MRTIWACVFSALAWLLAAGPASAESRLLAEAIGLTGPAMWLASGAPGLVLGVVRGPDSIAAAASTAPATTWCSGYATR